MTSFSSYGLVLDGLKCREVSVGHITYEISEGPKSDNHAVFDTCIFEACQKSRKCNEMGQNSSKS